MEPIISYENFTPSENPSFIDLAAAIPPDTAIKEEIIDDLCDANTTLFIPATPSSLGSGDVASNFRSKISPEVNNGVVQSWVDVFKNYADSPSTNPVVVTSVSREERRYTIKMLENGSVEIIDNFCKITDMSLTDIFRNFLGEFNITSDCMKIIRESSKGARYCSYGADMIGFINIMNWFYNREMFSPAEYMEPYVVTPEDVFHRKEVEGKKMLQPITKRGRTWTPMKGCNYLYFKTSSYKTNELLFAELEPGSMTKVYGQLFDLLKSEESSAKKMVRDFFSKVQYKRLSDFWYNDIDDGFTIIMILNAFRGVELTSAEEHISERFQDKYNTWITEINTKLNSNPFTEPEPEPEPELQGWV